MRHATRRGSGSRRADSAWQPVQDIPVPAAGSVRICTSSSSTTTPGSEKFSRSAGSRRVRMQKYFFPTRSHGEEGEAQSSLFWLRSSLLVQHKLLCPGVKRQVTDGTRLSPKSSPRRADQYLGAPSASDFSAKSQTLLCP